MIPSACVGDPRPTAEPSGSELAAVLYRISFLLAAPAFLATVAPCALFALRARWGEPGTAPAPLARTGLRVALTASLGVAPLR